MLTGDGQAIGSLRYAADVRTPADNVVVQASGSEKLKVGVPKYSLCVHG